MTNLEILKKLYSNYTKKYLGKIFLSVFFSTLVAGSTALIAYLLDPAIEKIFIDKNEQLMLLIPFAILFAFTVKGTSLYIAKILLIQVGGEVQRILQSQIMQSILTSSVEKVDKKHSGKFLSHINYDAGMVKKLVTDTILLFTKDTLTLFALVGVMFYQNWKLAIFAIIMIPLASFAAKSLGKRIGKVTTQSQEISGFLNSFFLEIIRNHKIIKIFQNENYENSRLAKLINSFKEKVVKIETVMNRATPIMETLTGLMIGGLIYYSGNLIIKGELELNNFFSFLAAMMLAYQPVRSLATLNMGIYQGISAAKRLLPIIEDENKDTYIDKHLVINEGNIKFEDVTFRYSESMEHVLDKINLNIGSAEMTALVGHSGAGKSTILNLIPRFYDPIKGKIYIDNQAIDEFSIKSLRKDISLVSQDITLFDDTIKNNIKYSKLDASDGEIFEAAKQSNCDEFIGKMANGYDTLIGENGVKLSGGEKQRLSIARAMLKKSKIILLDEATSSLDSETEEKIQKAINHLIKGRTTIVIAHRLSTVINSNKIYVIENGKVIGEGKHEELLTSSDIYKKFYQKQLSKV
ncbi:ABC transporter ATP-binding protein/permease [Candidatus Pelagibacter sp.]|nr:ABC transporter ATP-binding protein/permease [Candidatus Pelagibacter sp.]|tara:strand:+ start:346 stop:2079 length:1734 start_codon:yes stop_codon:yes gene_type:complete